MKMVFFLGAGFSAPYGHPTMKQFLEVAAASNRIKDEDKRFIEDLVLEALRANSILESSPTNLEDILSFAVMGDRLGLLGNDGKARGPCVKSIIRSIYSKPKIRKDLKYFNRFSHLKGFIGIPPDQWREKLVFITTNYDLNIESALVLNQLTTDYGIPFKKCDHGNSNTSQFLFCNDNGVKVFKLHGSVNWFRKANESEDLFVEDHIVRSKNYGGIEFPYACEDDYPIEGEPLIIPPSFLKPELDSPLPMIWKGAAKALNSAEKIIFIGYSFPPSDVEMKFFLAASIAENPKLREIVVVDINADQIVDRLKSPESGYGSHFKEFLRSKQNDWRSITKILGNN